MSQNGRQAPIVISLSFSVHANNKKIVRIATLLVSLQRRDFIYNARTSNKLLRYA
jgi:hypothetical protein